jgi:tRNA 2-thiouridine synthesizing protein A
MDITPNHTLDASGLACPLPIIKMKKAVDGMKPGEILKMIATDPGSVSDVKAWTGKTGHELLGHEETAGKHVFFIRKAKESGGGAQ